MKLSELLAPSSVTLDQQGIYAEQVSLDDGCKRFVLELTLQKAAIASQTDRATLRLVYATSSRDISAEIAAASAGAPRAAVIRAELSRLLVETDLHLVKTNDVHNLQSEDCPKGVYLYVFVDTAGVVANVSGSLGLSLSLTEFLEAQPV